MDLKGVRRVSSAGYRLPERSNGTKPVTTAAPADRTRRAACKSATPEPNQNERDPVRQEQVWKEQLHTERRAVREWEMKWGFLRHYDQMGQQKPQEPIPSYISPFSDRLPNTTNQMFGSRLSTPLSSELVKLDRLSLSGSHHRRKQDPELLPW